MVKRPFFSVLIPVYNQEDKMRISLDSLREQTFQDFEIIYVDDGSTDASYAQLQAFASQDDRIHIFRHEKNASLLAARFTGMRHAAGEYILFLDSDDHYTPDALESLHAAAAERSPDILFFGVQWVRSKREMHPQASDDFLRDCFAGKIAPGITAKCCSKKVVDRVLATAEPFYCNMGEDSFLSTVLFSNADSVHTVDRLFYQYVDEGGMSTKGSLNMAKLKRALDSVNASGQHIIGYIEKYKPEYRDGAREAADRMLRYVALQYSLYVEDYREIFDYLDLIRREGYRDAFEFACRRVLAVKVQRSMGMEAGFGFDLQ